MDYLNQVDARIHEARRYLAHAALEAENWPSCGHLLARALEHASCAVVMAWGEPHTAEKKMHRFFAERLAPHLNQDVVQFVQIIWQREGQGRPDADDLSDEKRHVLRQALAAADRKVPAVRLVFFGSRAAGTAQPDSD